MTNYYEMLSSSRNELSIPSNLVRVESKKRCSVVLTHPFYDATSMQLKPETEMIVYKTGVYITAGHRFGIEVMNSFNFECYKLDDEQLKKYLSEFFVRSKILIHF